MDISDIFLVLIAILFPPFAVWVKRGICSADSLINICLCALGIIPGIFHAWYIISLYSDHEQSIRVDTESARTDRFVIIQEGNGERAAKPLSQFGMGYGAVSCDIPSNTHRIKRPHVIQAQNELPEGSQNHSGLPSYQEAIRTSHKIQTNN